MLKLTGYASIHGRFPSAKKEEDCLQSIHILSMQNQTNTNLQMISITRECHKSYSMNSISVYSLHSVDKITK